MVSKSTHETLIEKLTRALKAKAVLSERSKQLQQQVEDFRKREDSMTHVATELLDRQRELNFMLHRASSVLHQLQDTNLALSAEFSHIVKELPAPEDPNWNETVDRVNDLFRKTHDLAGDMQEEIFRTAQTPTIPRMEPAPKPVPQPEPVVAHTEEPPAPQPEIVHEAEVTELHEEPTPVQVVVQAAEQPEQTQQTGSIDDLFARVESMRFEEDSPVPALAAEESRKQGFFARLLGKRNDE